MSTRKISWRTRALIYAAVLIVSVIIAWLTTRSSSSSSDASPIATLPPVGRAVQEPGIGTNPELGGQTLPNVTIRDLNGNPLQLATLTGTALVINFWYASCVPCKTEMPEFVKAQAVLGDTVRFVGLDIQDSPAVTRKFADLVGVHYELYVDADNAAVDALKLSRMPTTVFVAANGTITSIQSGALTEAPLLQRIHAELSV